MSEARSHKTNLNPKIREVAERLEWADDIKNMLEDLSISILQI